MEPTQATPAGFILGGGGGVGAGSVGKGTEHFNMQGRTARMPGPGCLVAFYPSLTNWVGSQGRRGNSYGNPGACLLGPYELSSHRQALMATAGLGPVPWTT